MLNRRAVVLILALFAALPSSAAAAPADQGAPARAWTAITGGLAARGPQGAPVETRPRKFEAFTLDRAALGDRLAGAPLEATRAARSAPVLVSIPAPDGTLQRFEAVESPVMQPALASRHPEIATFSAVGVDDPTATARFDVTALGFHASVRSDRGFWYVDPYYRNQDVTHVSYFGRHLPNVHGPLLEPEDITPSAARAAAERAPGDIVIQRTYRLALLTDPSYATYFGGGANVASANATLLNRVNQIYNDDLAIKLVLFGNDAATNDKLNLDTDAEFSGANGPCGLLPCYSPPVTGEQCDTQTLLATQMAIDTIAGPANYDVGHLGVGKPGGGIAGLGVVGIDGVKARGCTGVPTPKGDLYAVDYFAHEVGHQFGGNHTFNGANGSCAGNENNDTGVEPGSGSSIQAYAGICDTDNLQPHSDPYFSQKSIDEILAFVTGDEGADAENDGFIQTTTTNHSPVVTAPAARTIPIQTPFTLTGSATDSDAGQSLIYLWEQNDGGAPKALLDNAKPDGPLFRVFSFAANVSEISTLLSPSPGENIATAGDFSRTFPDAGQIAAGNTNAAAGTCPAASTPPTAIQIECFSEFLPTSARTMNFRLTARDRFATGGGATLASTQITVAGTAPFRTTSQATPASVSGGSVVPVTWNVAGTNAAPFNTPDVRILYSTDGGLTFPTVLAPTTANDGSENVTIPTTTTSTGRIRVEAVGNYFFDVTRGNLTVTAAAAVTPTPTVTPTATSPYIVPTPTPTVAPNRSFVRPDVSRTARRLKVKGNRKVKVRVACLAFNSPTVKRCRGTVGLFAKIDGGRQRRIARRAVSVPTGKSRVITLKLSARAFRVLGDRGTLSAKVRARTNGGVSRKQVTLRR